MKRATAAQRLCRFFENPVVNRVNRRDIIRKWRLTRSTCEVQIFSSAGVPQMARFSAAIICAGLYRRSESNPVPE